MWCSLLNQIENEGEIKKKKLSTLDIIEQAPLKDLIQLLIIAFLLFFGALLGVFSAYKTQYFADAYNFMNGLRSLFNLLLTNLFTYPEFQTPALISNLHNIMIFNFLYTNIILISDPSFLTMILHIPPNASIQDVILGFSILIFFTFNIIDFIYGERLHIPKSISFKLIYLVISISGSFTIIGIMFINWLIISMAALIIVLSLVVLGLWLPLE